MIRKVVFMGHYKRQSIAASEPTAAATLADMLDEGLSIFVGAIGAAIMRCLIRCRWQMPLAACFRCQNLAHACDAADAKHATSPPDQPGRPMVAAR